MLSGLVTVAVGLLGPVAIGSRAVNVTLLGLLVPTGSSPVYSSGMLSGLDTVAVGPHACSRAGVELLSDEVDSRDLDLSRDLQPLPVDEEEGVTLLDLDLPLFCGDDFPDRGLKSPCELSLLTLRGLGKRTPCTGSADGRLWVVS